MLKFEKPREHDRGQEDIYHFNKSLHLTKKLSLFGQVSYNIRHRREIMSWEHEKSGTTLFFDVVRHLLILS